MDMKCSGLEALETRLKQDLDWLDLPAKSWVPPRFSGGSRVLDVAIIGGGMAGLAASWMLKRLGIANQCVYDRAPAGLEGPWATFARMPTLRSPKQLSGPATGLPALTFRAYYEARFGREAWEELGKAPREIWMDYLVWYRHVLDLPVLNDVTVTAILPREEGLELSLGGAVTESVIARHVVLATGRDGLGGPFVPAIARGIDRRFWVHSSEPIDFLSLRGKRIAVIGAGASSMDNAATALEAGAARLDLFLRRADIPRVNKFTGIGSQGVVHGFAGLSDEWKWRFLDHTLSAQTPPPRDSTLRVTRHANAHVHLGSPLLSAEPSGDHLVVTTPKGRYEVDFVIFGTGFSTDLSRRPELAAFASQIRFWGDVFSAPADEENAELAASPYLGESFEFTEKNPGSCPALSRIHCFNFPATLSHGKLSGDIPGISEGADRLARGIVRRIFVDDRATHFANLQSYDQPELLGDEWTDSDAVAMPLLSE